MTAKYSSVVIAPAQIVLGIASGIVLAVILYALDNNLWPAAILVLLFISALGYFLSTITVEIDDKHITIGQGRREKHPRVVYLAEVRGGEIRSLTWAQCFGFGIESDERTTRFTVRRGPNLFLTLFDGEQIRISVDNIDAAVDALDLEVEPAPAATEPTPTAPGVSEAFAPQPDFPEPFRTDPVFVAPATAGAGDAQPAIEVNEPAAAESTDVRPRPRPRAES
ncbi:MAG: hypothetical protein ABI345_14775 [Jatrophihabitans sp.]